MKVQYENEKFTFKLDNLPTLPTSRFFQLSLVYLDKKDLQKSNDATYLNLALNADFNILHFKYYMVLIEGIFQ